MANILNNLFKFLIGLAILAVVVGLFYGFVYLIAMSGPIVAAAPFILLGAWIIGDAVLGSR